jgi:hypothetical protein
MRLPAALVMLPKLSELILRFGLPHWTVLVMLVASDRSVKL